ncbi:sigma-54 dependent transcriptional regulator [Marispirochaeta aestuarii]|uniref:sigma-54-dependent transcriptional regulator n=1 Tax=Marispirochaeta aestuarii TaxID=1963862 RepID=UPI0029C62ED7|nr:sigma-54 dependent transcriptional regulator [Marispirochaeta aestuarii]
MKTILIVDDELNMQTVLKILFESHGYSTLTAADGIQALDLIDRHQEIDLVVSDLKMPGMDGIALLEEIKLRKPWLPFVLVSAYGTIERAVEAMKMGAVDFITKPFNKELILHTVNRLWQLDKLKRENTALRDDQKELTVIFRSPLMRDIAETLRKIGRISSPVLLTGESGSGKEVVARALHSVYQGDEDLPFISINCPAVPESLLESELFGYKKGAFTGADDDFEGKVRMAEGGTLFLDEIGDLPLSIQPKLLRMLENKTIEPLGSNRPVKIRTRIVCATNRNLEQLVEEGKFRRDLFYRINTFHLELPPLRKRREDIAPLAEYFLDTFVVDFGLDERYLTDTALRALESYHWPGNVRELKNVIERCVVLSSGSVIEAKDLPADITREPYPVFDSAGEVEFLTGKERTLHEMEKKVLLSALDACDGNISAAARRLGVSRNTMRYRLKKYGIEPGAFPPHGGS